MQNKHYLLLGLFFLYLFSSCNKQSTLSPTTSSGDSTLDAKMAAYGFKPYTGSMDSVSAITPMTFEQFASKMALIEEAFKQHTATGRVKTTLSADFDTSQDYVEDGEDTTEGFILTNPSATMTFQYSYLRSLGFPSVFSLQVEGMGGNVQGATFTGAGGSYFRMNSGINASQDTFDPNYIIEGDLSFTVSITNSSGTSSLYNISYYVANYIQGSSGQTNIYQLTSDIILTKN